MFSLSLDYTDQQSSGTTRPAEEGPLRRRRVHPAVVEVVYPSSRHYAIRLLANFNNEGKAETPP